MNWKLSRFRTGDWVEVRDRTEILATLDNRGCIDELPFMPEMLQFCGRRFRVGAVAHKTCDTARRTSTTRRLQTAVHLEGVRCDGSAHDGCQAECLLFWKDAWLKPVSGDVERTAGVRASAPPRDGNAPPCTEIDLLLHTQTADAAGQRRYTCQATRMYEATEAVAWWDIRHYVFDVVTRNRTLGQVLRVTALAFIRWVLVRIPTAYRLRMAFSDWIHRVVADRGAPTLGLESRLPAGASTPVGRLGLQPGELVRIKSKAEIEHTIDRHGRNRGLTFDAEEMAPYCGKVVKVHKAVTRIIEEPTGRMIEMKQPCIMLEGVICSGDYASCRLNCPRAIPSYWRELWLERIGNAGTVTT